MNEEITSEEKLKVLREQFEEMKDTQTVNKLDIINLNNEVDALKLTSNQMTPETEKKMEDILKITQKLDKFKKLDNLINDVSNLKKGVAPVKAGSKPGYSGTKELSAVSSKINQLEQSINILETKFSSLKPVRIPESGESSDPKIIQEIMDKLEMLESKIVDTESLQKKIDNIERAPPASDVPSPPAGQITISQIRGLEDFMYNKFKEMSDLIKDGIERNAQSIEDLHNEMEIIKRRLEDIDRLKAAVKQFDMTEIKREFEKIKIKSEYLQDQLEKMDLMALQRKIEEIEHKIRVNSASSALVIE